MVRTSSQVSDPPETNRPDPNEVEKKKQADKLAYQKERQARVNASTK